MKKNIGVKITSLAMPFVILLTSSGCKLNKESGKYEEIEGTTFSDSLEDEVISSENLVLELTQNSSDYNLGDLLELVDSNTSHFSDDMRTYLRNIIERSFYNSKDLNYILKSCGFKGNGDFIKRKVIDGLKNIKEIKILSSEKDEDYYELLDKQGATRWDGDTNTIYLFTDTLENYDRAVLEEIIHAGQALNNTFDYSESLIKDEGDANFAADVLTYGKINNNYFYSFYDENDREKVSLGYGLGYFSYSFASKYFMYLLSLTDCDTIEKFIDENNYEIVTEKLSNLYGIDGEAYYNDMRRILLDSYSGIDDMSTDVVKKCEKTYLDCLEKKIDLIDSKDKVLAVIDLYRYINLQFGYEYFNDDGSKIKFMTDEVLDRNKIINKLYEKAEKYNAFKLSDNEEINKLAFNALINPKRDEENMIHFMSITDKKITLNEDKLIISDGKDSYETNLKNLVSENIVCSDQKDLLYDSFNKYQKTY